MKVKDIKRIIYLILVIIWMIVVFRFSNQNGTKSQGSSDIITNKIVEISDDYFALDIKSSEDTISFVVRKLAHFSIYFLNCSNTLPSDTVAFIYWESLFQEGKENCKL